MRSQVTAQSYGSRGASWESKGYSGAGNVEGLIDSLHGRPAIVAGSGKGVFDEVDFAVNRFRDRMPLVFAVNDVGVLLPRVDHLVSLHTPKLDLWAELRRDPTSSGYGNRDFHVHDAGLYGDREWYQWKNLVPTMALSGMFAAQVAYLMGCEPIILCGCPNDNTPRFWERECGNFDYSRVQQQVKEEMGFKPDFKRVVRAMGGWSRDFFGEP